MVTRHAGAQLVAQPDQTRARRRRTLELSWVVGVVLFTLARFGAAWGALGEEERWVVWVFGVIDLGTAVPYALGTARLVTSLVDRRLDLATRWGLVASGSFLAPYLWLGWAGRDGEFPTVVYVAVAVCVTCFGANAVISVIRKVRRARAAGPPDVAPPLPVSDTDPTVDPTATDPALAPRSPRTTPTASPRTPVGSPRA
jgi:hypothetical protein